MATDFKIDDPIMRVIEDEITRRSMALISEATQKLNLAIPEIIAGVVLRVYGEVNFERGGQDLRIHVKLGKD